MTVRTYTYNRTEGNPPVIVLASSAKDAARIIQGVLIEHGYTHTVNVMHVVEWPLKAERWRLLGLDGDY